MSEDFKYTPGLHNVGSYQVAGSPFVTSSTVSQDQELQIDFPRVTNNVTVKLDSAGGSGVTYNSVEVKGVSVFYQNSNTILASNGDSRTITTWLSASNSGAGPDNGIVVGGTAINNQFCIREKLGQPYQAVIRDSVGVKVINGISFPTGWFHLALVANSSAYFRVLIDGVQQANIAIASTDGTYLGGGILMGPPANGETDLKFRDTILWDDALSNIEVSDLYNAGASYSDPAFSVANKLVWVKPDNAVAPSPVNTLTNSGDASYGDMSLNSYTVGETAEVIAEAPFADVPGGGGELRIHYRSTGSLPDVVNNNHYWTLSGQDEEIKMNVKTKEIYLSAVNGDCDFSLHSDLTNIPVARMYQHTGSGVDE
jgi:hypothetical protein